MDLVLDSSDGVVILGQAEIALSSGRMIQDLFVKGKYKSSTDQSDLKMKGGGALAKLKALTADGVMQTLTGGDVKYKILGQKGQISIQNDSCTLQLIGKERQPRPLASGVSGSSIEPIILNGEAICYTGTLGGLVKNTATQEIFFLSNNHILAKENMPDLPANTGDPFLDSVLADDGAKVIQVGLFDKAGACVVGDDADVVGFTEHWVDLQLDPTFNPANFFTLPVNLVDAAIASITGPQDVDVDGTIHNIGTVSGTTTAANVGMPVQKMGRSSDRTFGIVTAINVVLLVQYDGGFGRFDNQIEIQSNCNSPFSLPGDSGALILNVPNASDRQVVGLLFAGSQNNIFTFANPIARVLADLESAAGVANLSVVECEIDGAGSDNCNHVLATDVVPACGSALAAGDAATTATGQGVRASPQELTAPTTVDPKGLELAARVNAAHSKALLKIPGVFGHGIAVEASGKPYIRVYVDDASRMATSRQMPAALDGVVVHMVETGGIRAY
jgi:hypothetical protein